MTLVLSIRTLQTKKTRSAFDRKDLDFKKVVKIMFDGKEVKC